MEIIFRRFRAKFHFVAIRLKARFSKKKKFTGKLLLHVEVLFQLHKIFRSITDNDLIYLALIRDGRKLSGKKKN